MICIRIKSFLHLMIKDNGVGMSQEENPDDPETFGLLLINILATQFDESVVFAHDKGTTAKVTFKAREQSDRMASIKEQAE